VLSVSLMVQGTTHGSALIQGISESVNSPPGHQSKPSEEPIPVVAHLLGGGRFQDKAHQERYPRSCTESAYHPFKNNQ
jgi:hypothetical protein